MISDFIKRAKKGESVYLCDVRDAFSSQGTTVLCVTELLTGEKRRYPIGVPLAADAEENEFVREYFYANIYNLISVLGGKRITVYLNPEDEYAAELCDSLDEVFETKVARLRRNGYGKCLNVTDRVNASMGLPPFRFEIVRGKCSEDADQSEPADSNAISAFKSAVFASRDAVLCGMDIGGTDIKVVGAKNGRIAAVKEYDWSPGYMTNIESLIEPILLLARVMGMALFMPETARSRELRAAMLDKNASYEDMQLALAAAKAEFGTPEKIFDGIGVCFPDVVIRDKIVGGETFKTRGIREHSPDYEREFSRLLELNSMLLEHCRPGGAVHIANDGSLAAYTAAAELAHSESAAGISNGVFAHTLGTELGTGWIDESGEIPQIPLEVYNCVIDIGNYPARKYDVNDLRSVSNFNTGLHGTLQKYASQSGAYRLALQYFRDGAPALYQELFDKGFIEEKDGGIYVTTYPNDMRKSLLEHIMELADCGKPEARRIFREIGRYLAVTWKETEYILCPRVKSRVLYGRFIKRRNCFELMREGANEIVAADFTSGDSSLAHTPLMKDLKADMSYTVAQFGQAVGAAHFAASVLSRKEGSNE